MQKESTKMKRETRKKASSFTWNKSKKKKITVEIVKYADDGTGCCQYYYGLEFVCIPCAPKFLFIYTHRTQLPVEVKAHHIENWHT